MNIIDFLRVQFPHNFLYHFLQRIFLYLNITLAGSLIAETFVYSRLDRQFALYILLTVSGFLTLQLHKLKKPDTDPVVELERLLGIVPLDGTNPFVLKLRAAYQLYSGARLDNEVLKICRDLQKSSAILSEEVWELTYKMRKQREVFAQEKQILESGRG